jgi:hypothetical protein
MRIAIFLLAFLLFSLEDDLKHEMVLAFDTRSSLIRY